MPGGVGNSDLQLKMMLDLGVTAYAGTPSFLAALLEKAEAMGIHTLRYKLTTWSLSAFFVGVVGGISAFQLIHFEPLETADR